MSSPFVVPCKAQGFFGCAFALVHMGMHPLCWCNEGGGSPSFGFLPFLQPQAALLPPLVVGASPMQPCLALLLASSFSSLSSHPRQGELSWRWLDYVYGSRGGLEVTRLGCLRYLVLYHVSILCVYISLPLLWRCYW